MRLRHRGKWGVTPAALQGFPALKLRIDGRCIAVAIDCRVGLGILEFDPHA